MFTKISRRWLDVLNCDQGIQRKHLMAGDGAQAPGAVVQRTLDSGEHRHVVHFFNLQSGGFHSGSYHTDETEAMAEYTRQIKRYDPTGMLHREAERVEEIERTYQALCLMAPPTHRLEVPVLNNNGTSKQALLDQYRHILDCFRDLQEAFANATPHGRDWQTVPNGSDVANDARQAFAERRARLKALYDEVHAVALGIASQEGR